MDRTANARRRPESSANTVPGSLLRQKMPRQCPYSASHTLQFPERELVVGKRHKLETGVTEPYMSRLAPINHFSLSGRFGRKQVLAIVLSRPLRLLLDVVRLRS